MTNLRRNLQNRFTEEITDKIVQITEKLTLSRQKIVSFGRDFKHPVQDCIEVAGPLVIY